MSAILIIEDEHALGTALSFAVRRGGHIPTLVASGQAGLQALKQGTFDAVVLDIGLPDVSGLKVLEKLREKSAALPVLVVTAHATLDHAISAQKLGATQYLTKPLDLKQFEHTLSSLISKAMPLSPEPLVPTVKAATLIGAASCLQEVFIGIARACAGDVPALITGATGTGKSLAAAVIHANGLRAAQPLKSLECARLKDAAALDKALAESAKSTLVLEEIAQLSTEAQTRLAAWLADPPEQRARLLATTSTDPRESVTIGTLRAELFYAFSTLTIPLPPLRERAGDISALSSYFLGIKGGSAAEIRPPALTALQAYDWPGNVRELRHVLDYAASVRRGGPIFLSHLPSHVSAIARDPAITPTSGELDSTLERWLTSQLGTGADLPSYDALLDHVEAAMLRHLLNRFENKPTHLAASLRMNRATLRQKLRRAGLQRDEEG